MPIDPQWLATLADELRPYAPWVMPWLVKYAPAAAESLVKVFRERYKHDTPATQAAARKNVADVAQRFARHLDEMIESGRVTDDDLRARLDDPDFVKVLQDLLLDASQTSDELLHEELARLMAERLTSKSGSRKAIFLRMAGEKLHDLTSREIRTLSLIYCMLDVGPTNPMLDTTDAFVSYAMLEVVSELAPFSDLDLDQTDLDHFEELGLAIVANPYRGAPALLVSDAGVRSRLLAPLSIGAQHLPEDVQSNPFIRHAWSLLHGNKAEATTGINDVYLTPVGKILGQCGYCIARGHQFQLAEWWDEPTQSAG